MFYITHRLICQWTQKVYLLLVGVKILDSLTKWMYLLKRSTSFIEVANISKFFFSLQVCQNQEILNTFKDNAKKLEKKFTVINHLHIKR